ncbi:hypothetical protein QSV34_06880 [Porticoccus sp. W117]|uniref:hypothetical protein n=1 Tax=Porticoccus sp. W117 TaxID=3054777 RepID=UPI0025969654|nr:hypothetical protein [Porticoccus sp. W117]MDM3871079.1 hypothetical protein [Porticoccus sp. W117]
MSSSKKYLAVFLLSFLGSGILEAIYPSVQDAISLAHALIIAFLMFGWCVLHASEHSISPPSGAKILCAFLPPIGVPYYLYKSFGFKNGSTKLALGFLFLVCSFLVYMAPFYAIS